MSDFTLADIRDWFAAAVDEYRCDTGMSMEEAKEAFDRTLAAHDASLREQIDPTPIRTIRSLQTVPSNAVLVDALGVAWQVGVAGGDTRRTIFWQAGGHRMWEAYEMGTILPMRIVDDGREAES